jgi:transcriptional regulator with XRE-family HTH domain
MASEENLEQLRDELRESIEAYRRKHGPVTLREIARRAELSNSILTMILNGKTVPSEPTLRTLAKLLALDVNRLLYLAGRADMPTKEIVNPRLRELLALLDRQPTDVQDAVINLLESALNLPRGGER